MPKDEEQSPIIDAVIENGESELKPAVYDVHTDTAYARVQRPFVRQRAATRIQRNWRYKLREKHKETPREEQPSYLRKDSKGYYAGLSNTDSLYLREPEGDFGAFREALTTKIKTGCYHELDFRHPHFVRLLYQSLRLEHITANELLTAKLMYDALFAFNTGEMPEYPNEHFTRTPLTVDDPMITDISYMSREAKGIIDDALAKDADKYHYYSIEFNDQQIVYMVLGFFASTEASTEASAKAAYKGQHAILLLKFLEKHENKMEAIEGAASIAEDIKASLESFQKDPPDREKRVPFCDKLNRLMEALGFKINAYAKNKDAQSLMFLIALNLVHCQIPGMKVVDTPGQGALATFTVPTIDTLNLVQSAVHGEEMTIPAPVTGSLNTRLIRAYDDIPATASAARTQAQHNLALLFPSASELPGPSRPIELTHPDAPQTERPHNHDCYDFFLTWHDLFHAWRNGENCKERIRRFKRIHDEKAGLARADTGMSKILWKLSDLDEPTGRPLRELALKRDVSLSVSLVNIAAFTNWFQRTGERIERSNENLWLVAFDIASNPALWKRLNGGMTLDGMLTELVTMAIYHGFPAEKKEKILEILIEMVGIITPQLNKERTHTEDTHPFIEIYLRHLLFNGRDPVAAGSDILFSALKQIGYKRIFYWSANTGIYIQKAYRHLFCDNKLANNTKEQLMVSLSHIAFPNDSAAKEILLYTYRYWAVPPPTFCETPLAALEETITKFFSQSSATTGKQTPYEQVFKQALESLLTSLQAEFSDNSNHIARETTQLLNKLSKSPDQKAKLETIKRYTKNCRRHAAWDTFWRGVAVVAIAAVGFVVGAIVGACAGAWLGPGAAFTAVMGACKGATIGVAIGAALTGVSLGWGSKSYFFRSTPLEKSVNQVAQEAKDCVQHEARCCSQWDRS